MHFAKGHGTENDFVILPDPDAELDLTPDLVRRLCDRRAGIGADGVLRIVEVEVLAAALTESGPGAFRGPARRLRERCADRGRRDRACLPGRHRRGRAPIGEVGGRVLPGGSWTTATRTAPWPRCAATASACSLVTSSTMASPTAPNWPWRRGPACATSASARRADHRGHGPASLLGEARASVGGTECDGLRVSVGNPHLACVVAAPLEGYDFSVLPTVDPEPFPDGANVELIRLTGERSAQMRVYERGSGPTRSCGTGAVAAAVAAAAATAPGMGPGFRVPGGDLTVNLGPSAHLTDTLARQPT